LEIQGELSQEVKEKRGNKKLVYGFAVYASLAGPPQCGGQL